MTGVVAVAAVEGVTKGWKEEAEKRRRISRADPIADTLEYCAGELAARIKSAQSAETRLTVAQYASRAKVTPQTVCNWIRKGQLPAIDGPKGYLISADSKRVPLARAS